MKISDADAESCTTYAFGGTCDNEHVEACELFKIMVTLIDTPFE